MTLINFECNAIFFFKPVDKVSGNILTSILEVGDRNGKLLSLSFFLIEDNTLTVYVFNYSTLQLYL